MDRSKSVPKKPLKGKGHAPPGEFIALGAKSRSTSEVESKSGSSSAPTRKPLTSTGSVSGKRDAGSVSAGATLVPKKPKLSSQTFTPLGRSGDVDRRGSPTTQVYLYEEIAKEVDPSEIVDYILEACDREDDERVEALLCGAVKYLKANRAKPETTMYLSLMYLARHSPSIFNSEVVIEAFCSLLKRDVAMNFKAKGNALVSVLACNVLLAAFQDDESWPDNFIKVYMDDSLGERIWVDRLDCKAFVDNIQSAFNTKMPKTSVLSDASVKTGQSGSAGASPSHPSKMEEDEDGSLLCHEVLTRAAEDVSGLVCPRYAYQQLCVETYVLDTLREHLSRRQSMDGGSRHLLRVMTATCGYSEVRTMAAQRLEMWLQKPKLTRAAQDLLMSACLNCDQHTNQDIEVMSQISKIRLKTKPLITHYLMCVRELLGQHPDNLQTLMTHTVYNELSTSRNPNNMSLLSAMFNVDSEQSARILSDIFRELLTNRDDYLRALRALLREIVKGVRHDMNYAEFALGLMQERTDAKFKDMDPTMKERLFMSHTDLICLTALLSVSPSVREAASAHARGDQKDVSVLRSFQKQVAIIQRDSVWWLHTVVPKMFEVKQQEYVHCLRKLLFMEAPEHYFKIDNWPPDGERSTMQRLVAEVPALEDTLMRVMLMGLARDLPVSATDAIELADQLIKRAAVLYAEDFQVLKVERMDFINALLNLCTYRHPENIVLPKGYQPPALAITNLYWRAWIMMLIISAFNPSTFGFTAWENYPIIKCFMEMTMTRNFKFPPPTMATDEKSVEDIRAREKQIAEIEKQKILEFEGHLAAATNKRQITESNSLLMAQLTTMDPTGVPRRPPTQVLEQLKALNQTLQLGHMLCKSRSPDFLLDIIHRQGTTQSMPWLAELVESSDSSLDVLPVQCLCEFLLHDPGTGPEPDDSDGDGVRGDKKKGQLVPPQKHRKQEQLLARLQNLLYSASSDARTIQEVLNYFLQRLASHQSCNRKLAVKGLSMVLARPYVGSQDGRRLSGSEDNAAAQVIHSHKWLLEQLPAIPQFAAIKPQACSALRQACQIETEAAAVSAYIIFLSQHTLDLQRQELDELVLDMAQLIVERATLINHLLPQEGVAVHSRRSNLVLAAMLTLFYNYLAKAQEPEKEAYSWSNTQDQILLQWTSSKSATMNILVVHAMIILLTYGKPTGVSAYEDMLESWFPRDGHPPSAFLVDTSEEALLLPDWLKLRMIRSNNGRLVDAALLDLEPSQLLLFVQSFGIPVASMSKLLGCLDEAVHTDSYTMEQVVVDKAYMSQLVDVQHMRGAQGGAGFHAMLSQEKKLIADPEEDMEPAERKRTLADVARKQTLRDGQLTDPKAALEALKRIFNMDGGVTVTTEERRTAFRALHRALSKGAVALAVTTALLKLLDADGDAVVAALRGAVHHSCPTLRLLLHHQLHIGGALQELMERLQKSLDSLEGPPSPLVRLVRHFRESQQGVTSETRVQRELMSETSAVGAGVDSQIERVLKSDSLYKERLVDACVVENLGPSSTTVTASVCSALSGHLTSDKGVLTSAEGLLVDWLELLDPGMIDSCPELQRQLLFARRTKAQGGGASPCQSLAGDSQPYLLALLTYQGSWRAIQRCINILLWETKEQSYDSTAVLNFLNACIHIPKLWQGRDKKLPKNHVAEDVLVLTPQQIQGVVYHMVTEATLARQSTGAGDVTSGPSPSRVTSLSQRMPLLLRCCGQSAELVRAAADFLHERMKRSQSGRSECQQLLTEMYLRLPGMVESLEDDGVPFTDPHTSQQGQSKLDLLTHTMVCTLGNPQYGKASADKMYDANIACRKLAAQHPILVLRQLPMVAALLQGRAQYTTGEMKNRNHLTLYAHVIGILELLQPYLFHRGYARSLGQVIASYMELLKIHRVRDPSVGTVTANLIKLLHNLLNHDAGLASQLLRQHVATLTVLSVHFHEPALRSLLAALTLPRQESEQQDVEVMTPEVTLARPSSPFNMSDLAPFLQKLALGSPKEEVIRVLKDLDETSKRKVDVLQHFVSDLRRLMKDEHDTCRNSAHALVMRYVRQCPGVAVEFVPMFLQCLEHPNVDIVNTALRNLAEFSLLAQEYADELLLKAFNMGVLTKTETGSYVSEAVKLLNLETMLA